LEKIKRLDIFGVPVDVVQIDQAIDFVNSVIAANSIANTIMAVNPGKIMRANNNSDLKRTITKASLLIPDGIGIILGAKWLHGIKMSRVTGIDLMHKICRGAANRGHKIFVFGAEEKVNKQATENLKLIYQGISIVGRCNGYLPESKMEELIKKINDSGADILFIALGSPKQENWIEEHLPLLHVKVCQGVGGSLDIISGKKKRAPAFIQKIGFEWFYRFFDNPKQHFSRKLLDTHYFLKLISECIKKRLVTYLYSAIKG